MIGTRFLRHFFTGDGYMAFHQHVEDLQSVGDANNGRSCWLLQSVFGQRLSLMSGRAFELMVRWSRLRG